MKRLSCKTMAFLLSSFMVISCGGQKVEENATEKFAEGEFKQWAQTPPMGWNSWDCYGPTVVEEEVKKNADFMAENLKEFGWEYIVVDIRWFVENDKAGGYNETDQRYVIDEYGRYLPAVNRFPSAADGKGFKSLADYVHSKGLKFGIHIMRGIPKIAVEGKMPILGTDGITAADVFNADTICGWLRDNYTVDATKVGAQEYYNSIINMYAEWGVDYIKVDDLSKPYHGYEIKMIRNAIDQCGRPIVFSTSPGDTPVSAGEHLAQNANLWRMIDDLWDKWDHMMHLFEVGKSWTSYIKPGTWPDCDMIPLGHISIRGERGEDRMSLLSEDEQYTLMTYFTIMRSPLMFGGDLPTSGELAMKLLTNKEVLRMHKESEDVSYFIYEDDYFVVTSKNAITGEIYVAVINKSDDKDVKISDIKFQGDEIGNITEITELWSGKKMDPAEVLSTVIKPHASILLSVK